MSVNSTFSKMCSLSRLAELLNLQEAGPGPLQALDHNDDATIGVFEEAPTPARPLELAHVIEGQSFPGDLVCRGTVWILGQLQEVVAYRH